MNVIAIEFAMSMLAATSGHAAEHRTQIQHATGATDVQYRGSVDIQHKQSGAVAPGGAPSSLRCSWKANVTVERDARHASGTRMARSFATPYVMQGSRPGWCTANRDRIAQEVAQRTADIKRYLMAAAVDDHPVLTAEIDRLHGSAEAG